MFCRRIFGVLFLFLVLGGFFGLVNNSRGQDAYTQGYIAGQQSVSNNEDGTGTAVSPPPPTSNREFSFFGGLFKFFLFFFGFMFLIGMLGKAFGGKHRRHYKGEWNHDWGNWQKQAGKPPWFDKNDNDEPIMKA